MAACPNCGGFSRGDEPCEKCASEQKSVQASATGSTILAWLLAALVVGGVWTMTDGPPGSKTESSRSQAPAVIRKHVQYSVEGVGQAMVTYTNQTGGTDQMLVSVPWAYEFVAAPGAFLYISAQKQQEYGVIGVQIVVDGIPIQNATASAQYGVASANGVAR